MPHSYGVSITHQSGWKLCYSGDTTPCQRLVEGGELSILSCHGNCATQGTLLHVRGLWREGSYLKLSWKLCYSGDTTPCQRLVEGGELSILSCHGNCATQGTLLHVRGLWRKVSYLS